MPKINKLDPSIYNLISAGEVVENPSSVVKELVENSIDAGATEIYISIKEGGIKEIKIKLGEFVSINHQSVRSALASMRVSVASSSAGKKSIPVRASISSTVRKASSIVCFTPSLR